MSSIAQHRGNSIDSQLREEAGLRRMIEMEEQRLGTEASRAQIVADNLNRLIAEDALRLEQDSQRRKRDRELTRRERQQIEAIQIERQAQAASYAALADSYDAYLSLVDEGNEKESKKVDLLVRLGQLTEDEANRIRESTGRRSLLDSALRDQIITPEQLSALMLGPAEALDAWIARHIDLVDLDLVAGWMDARDAETEYAESVAQTAEQVEDLFDRQMQKLRALRDLERITDEEFHEQAMALLEEQLAILDAQHAELLLQDASAGDLLDSELKRLGIEQQIRDLMSEQNGELDEQDTVMVDLLRKRQDLLRSVRDGSANRSELDAVTARIVAHMQSQGASQAEINQVLESLPQYEEGGYVPRTGPARLHAGEFVIPRELVDTIVGGSQLPIQNMHSARFLHRARMDRASGADATGGVHITFNIAAGAQVDRSALRDMAEHVERIVQRGMDSGKFRPRS